MVRTPPRTSAATRRSRLGYASVWLVVAAMGLPACSPAYVLRAGYEEAKILWRRQSIAEMLRHDDIDAATRSKLELVLAVREFARDELHLRVDGSYATYARVDADQVVHVVTAAYRLRLQAYTWWFPIVGRVPYKGFFSQAAADAEAAALEQRGYDTYVRPSVAFSTLGWFADPLLSNLLRYDRATLANIIIHELLHNTHYTTGHVRFAESFATFVGYRGAMRFFGSRHDPAAAAAVEAEWRDALRFSAFLGEFTAHLRAAYAGGLQIEDRARVLAAGQATFRRLPMETATYREFGRVHLNNAVILQYLMYAERLRLFDRLLHAHRDNLTETIETVLAAVDTGAADPFAAVQATLSPASEAIDSSRGLDGSQPPDTVPN